MSNRRSPGLTNYGEETRATQNPATHRRHPIQWRGEDSRFDNEKS
jgi:hypothetical protein